MYQYKVMLLTVLLLSLPGISQARTHHAKNEHVDSRVSLSNSAEDDWQSEDEDYTDDDAAASNEFVKQSMADLSKGGARTFVFDPKRVEWRAYTGGKIVAAGRASGGRGYCPDENRRCKTPIGHFHVYSIGSADCISSKFPVGRGGAPMPYCMFFDGGYAVHGSYEVPNYNASHGCIRVRPSAAQWLSKNFMRPGTTVIVLPY